MNTNTVHKNSSRIFAPLICGFLILFVLERYNGCYIETLEYRILWFVVLCASVLLSWISSFLLGRKCTSLWEKILICVGQCAVFGCILCNVLYLFTSASIYHTILLVICCVVSILYVFASVALLIKMSKDKNTDVLYRHKVLLAHFPLFFVPFVVL